MGQSSDSAVPPADTDESSPRYPGWRVAAACFAVALFCWGFGLYGHGVYLAELQRIHGWPAALISGASTATYLASAVLLVFTHDAISRFGPRRFVLFGVAALGTSAALIPFATSPWQLYGAYLVMAFAWAAMGTVAIATILGLWFQRRRGLAISLALNGASCGGIVIAPTLVFLSAGIGFANAMLVATAVMAAVLVPMVLAWIDRPPHADAVPDHAAGGPAPAAPEPALWTRRAALRSFAFWTISAPFALALTAQVGVLVHQISFLEPVTGRAQAALAVTITTVMAVVGRLCLGALADRLDPRLATAASLVTQGAALAVMMLAANPTALLLACAAYGFSVGNIITLPPLIIQREFAPATFGMVMGLSTAIGMFVGAFGPGLLGLVRDLSGSYGLALGLCIALKLAAAATVLLRGRGAA